MLEKCQHIYTIFNFFFPPPHSLALGGKQVLIFFPKVIRFNFFVKAIRKTQFWQLEFVELPSIAQLPFKVPKRAIAPYIGVDPKYDLKRRAQNFSKK